MALPGKIGADKSDFDLAGDTNTLEPSGVPRALLGSPSRTVTPKAIASGLLRTSHPGRAADGDAPWSGSGAGLIRNGGAQPIFDELTGTSQLHKGD